MVNKSPIRVSVVMCTYNGERYVREQLLSIIAQTYPLKEVLVFDDASTDSTVSTIREIAALHPIIQLHINQKNLGYNRNFEQGLNAATGEAIAPSDQDDIWLPQKIERLISNWLPEHPVIYSPSYATDTIPHRPPALETFRQRFRGKDGRQIFIHNTVSGHTLLVRKSFLPLALPFPAPLYYDWWIALVAAYNGGVQYLPEILVYQRLHTRNATHFAKGEATTTQLHKHYKTDIIHTCLAAAAVPDIPLQHKELAKKMAAAVAKSFARSFYWPLFFLLLRHRTVFFSYKVKKFSLFSHIKYAYRLTRN